MEQSLRDCNPNKFELTYNQHLSIFPQSLILEIYASSPGPPGPLNPGKKLPSILSPVAAHIQAIISNQEAELESLQNPGKLQ
jgi:hypothetical protein